MGLLKKLFSSKRKEGATEKERAAEQPKLIIGDDSKLRISIQDKKESQRKKRAYKESEKETEVKCPYCQKELEKKPKRKSKCLVCGNQIFIRDNNLNRILASSSI